jgi:dimeric dUTPase (all-alpha-NTP-PPase superfamily)
MASGIFWQYTLAQVSCLVTTHMMAIVKKFNGIFIPISNFYLIAIKDAFCFFFAM